MDLLWIFVLGALIVIVLITILNMLSFPRLRKHDREGQLSSPFVSVLIPARDEAAIICETVHRLLAQNYPAYEVILLDDNSNDGTAERARQAGAGDSRLRIFQGLPLPVGWLGKNWACHQLADQAKGGVLVFTDADVRWEPDALRAILDEMQNTAADVFSVWPTQRTETVGERLVVPLMMFAVMGYLPELAVRFLPQASLAAANGQCLVFRPAAYQQMGGHAAVRDQVIEDVALARQAKRHGLRLGMALGGDLLWCRMYRDWREVRNGFAKNLLAGHGHPLFLLASTFFHWMLFLAPWIWLFTGGWLQLGYGWPFFPLALIGLGIGARLLSAAASSQHLLDAFWMPVSVLAMTVIAAQSFWWYRNGGLLWKGRRIAQKRAHV